MSYWLASAKIRAVSRVNGPQCLIASMVVIWLRSFIGLESYKQRQAKPKAWKRVLLVEAQQGMMPPGLRAVAKERGGLMHAHLAHPRCSAVPTLLAPLTSYFSH